MTNDYDLFKHMSDEWGLTLTGSELHEIRISAGLLELERDNARLRESLERLQKIASAFLGWHSDVINSGQRSEVVDAILQANHILSNVSRQGPLAGEVQP
jgi:hypothetical protein